MKIIIKIYSIKEERDALLKLILTCLSYEATKLKQSLFLLGKGSSGKS